MIKKSILKNKINFEICALIILIIITIFLTIYNNHTKKRITTNYKKAIENFYFKKTINHFFDNLEPSFKKHSHKVQERETFNSVLNLYDIKKNEISIITRKISKKINLKNLNTNHKISLTIDQSTNSVKEFIFQISNKEKIILTQDLANKDFSQKIVLTKLKKQVVSVKKCIIGVLI